MSTDDYQVQDIYKYSRKSYKENKRGSPDDLNSPRDEACTESSPRPRSRSSSLEGRPCCSYDIEADGEMAHILHKKCPVITLAQQQLQKLLDETDKLLCESENVRCCRSLYDFLCICKRILQRQDKCQCVLMILLILAFFMGLLLGGASCGSCFHGRFNSPILTCIDNMFISDAQKSLEQSFHSIA